MIRAHVTDDGYAGLGIRITLATYWEDGDRPREIVHLVSPEDGGQYLKLEEIDHGGYIAKPTLTLPDEMARALLDGLTRYYHGAEDTRALRRDYDAERVRVDKLTDALIGIASQATAPSSPFAPTFGMHPVT